MLVDETLIFLLNQRKLTFRCVRFQD